MAPHGRLTEAHMGSNHGSHEEAGRFDLASLLFAFCCLLVVRRYSWADYPLAVLHDAVTDVDVDADVDLQSGAPVRALPPHVCVSMSLGLPSFPLVHQRLLKFYSFVSESSIFVRGVSLTCEFAPIYASRPTQRCTPTACTPQRFQSTHSWWSGMQVPPYGLRKKACGTALVE